MRDARPQLHLSLGPAVLHVAALSSKNVFQGRLDAKQARRALVCASRGRLFRTERDEGVIRCVRRDSFLSLVNDEMFITDALRTGVGIDTTG